MLLIESDVGKLANAKVAPAGETMGEGNTTGAPPPLPLPLPVAVPLPLPLPLPEPDPLPVGVAGAVGSKYKSVPAGSTYVGALVVMAELVVLPQIHPFDDEADELNFLAPAARVSVP